jgi:hypothetical protein
MSANGPGASRAWHDPGFRSDALRLFVLAERHAGRYPRVAIPYRHRNTSGELPLVFKGGSLRLLQELTARIVGRSRLDTGLSEKDAERLLINACGRAIGGDSRGALLWLVESLDEPVVTWTVVEPADLVLVSTTRLVVGRSTYTTSLPPRIRRRILPTFLDAMDGDCFVSTDVLARDAATARALAREAFADSAAVLDLMDKRAAAPGGAFIAIPDAGSGGITFSRSGWIIDASWLGQDHKLIPPFRQLSRALAKREDTRTDWERRVVAATRWLSRASRSTTTPDRLVSVMIALEALLIEDRHERSKGALLAKRLTERIRVRSHTAKQQEDWIAELYQRRNDAVHEGREYVNDLEVDDLLDLARYAVRYACEHLAAKHARHACETFSEAMFCPIWYGASR